MKAAIIGAGSESIHAIEEAKKQGIMTVALDHDPEAEGFKAADKGLVVDLSDEQTVIEALRGENVDFILTVPIGRYLTTVGAANEALGLPGISRKAAVCCTDKYEFHKRLRDYGLRACHCYLVNRENLFPPDRIDYPAVLKPRYGFGSRAIHYLTNPEQLLRIQVEELELDETDKQVRQRYGGLHSGTNWDATVQAKEEENERLRRDLCTGYRELQKEKMKQVKEDSKPLSGDEWIIKNKRELEEKCKTPLTVREKKERAEEDYILEEAAQGIEYGVDAAMEGCNFEIILLRKKILTPLPARQAVGYISVLPEEERDLYERVKKHLDKVVEKLGIRECMFRADIVVNRRDIFVIELSARPAAHNLHNLFIPLATGIDIYREFLCYMSGKRHNFQPIQVKKMMIHYFDLENCFVHKIPKPDQLELPDGVVLRGWKCDIKTLDYLESVTTDQSVMKRGYFILEGEREACLLQAADMIKGQFEVS